MDPLEQHQLRLTRRALLGNATRGVGALALASLINPSLLRAADLGGTTQQKMDKWAGVISPTHLPAKAKRVIWLTMAGGPSHLETFDYKPKLAELSGKPMPESLTKGQPIAQLQGAALKCFAPQHAFKKCGKSGQEISEIFPLLGQMADEMCIIRSMHTDAINHDPAHTFMNT